VKLTPIQPPRSFGVGKRGGTLEHVADVELDHDEVVTLHTGSGTEFDVTRKSWGYYATPSLNGRLREHGLRAVLAVGVPRADGEPERMYVLLVEAGREDDFQTYIDAERMRVVGWLDTDAAIADAARKLEERE
jgi:hypothetical protein